MSLKKAVLIFGVGWLVLISALHAYLNVNWVAIMNDYLPAAETKDHCRVYSGNVPAHLPGD